MAKPLPTTQYDPWGRVVTVPVPPRTGRAPVQSLGRFSPGGVRPEALPALSNTVIGRRRKNGN
jgi:hypothetical protein